MPAFSDQHRVAVPDGWTARDFASQILDGSPQWLRTLLKLRDSLVGKLGFAVQPGADVRRVTLEEGQSAGPFTFTVVDDDEVRGGNSDRHITFESAFRVEHDAGRSYGILQTDTHSTDAIGHVYLSAIWPIHRLLMGAILRHGMSTVG